MQNPIVWVESVRSNFCLVKRNAEQHRFGGSHPLRAVSIWLSLAVFAFHAVLLGGCSTIKKPEDLTVSEFNTMRESQARERIYEQRKQALAAELERKAITDEEYAKGVSSLDELGRKEIEFQKAIVRKDAALPAIARSLCRGIGMAVFAVPAVVVGGAMSFVQSLAQSGFQTEGP